MGYRDDSLARIAARNLLIWIGRFASVQQVEAVHGMLNYVEAGRWIRAQGFQPKPQFSSRDLLHAHVARDISASQVLYLEFGVFNGTSLRSWCTLLQHPQSELHGFDSFEGLPENWNADAPKWTFGRSGIPPEFDDRRVTLHQGWFQDTLPSFVAPAHDRLVLHLDADLYSSTKYVLDHLVDLIKPGSIILFDEFHDRLHEMRAFSEFLEETGMKFRFLGYATYLAQCAFERSA